MSFASVTCFSSQGTDAIQAKLLLLVQLPHGFIFVKVQIQDVSTGKNFQLDLEGIERCCTGAGPLGGRAIGETSHFCHLSFLAPSLPPSGEISCTDPCNCT